MSKRLWSQPVSDEAAELYFYTTRTFIPQNAERFKVDIRNVTTFVEAKQAVDVAEINYIAEHCNKGDCPFRIEDKVDVAYRIYKEAIANA